LPLARSGEIAKLESLIHLSVPDSFECEHCRETVDPEIVPLHCRTCGTTYRYDTTKAAYTVVTSRVQFCNIIAVLLIITGIAGLISSRLPSGFTWFCIFAGFALHYWNGARTGVLSSHFILFRRSWTVYRAESPTLFSLAMIIEGFFVVVLFFMFLFSLWEKID
jgi:hypothetical protein